MWKAEILIVGFSDRVRCLRQISARAGAQMG